MGYYDDWVDPNGTFRNRRGQGRSITIVKRIKRTCPHCGKKYIGLEDHIRDKHGSLNNA